MINDFFNILLPQGCLAIFVVIQFVLSVFMSPRKYLFSRMVSLVGISLAVVLLATVQVEPQYFGMRGALMSDEYTLLFHFVILACGFFAVLLSRNILSQIKQSAYTYQGLVLTGIIGAMSVVSSNDFLTLFVGLELLSFPIYFMISAFCGYYSKEAAFKYLLTSAVSTGVFLFGVSYIYGITGSLNFNEIYEYTANGEASVLYSLAVIMILAGMISKLAVFPFANWVIDVYKGCETSVLAFISTVPKLALFGAVCRLLVFPLSASFELTLVLIVLSLVTGLWANAYGIREKNVKGIMACSSASNSSYVLLTAALVSVYNLSAVIFYLICYVFMNIAVFGYLNMAERVGIGMDTEDYKGMFAENPAMSVFYVISVVALAGFPITSGFIAKIYLFSAIAKSGLIFLPVLLLLLLLTVVALYYYLKLVTPIFAQKEPSERKSLEPLFSQKFALVVCTLVTLAVGIFPEKLAQICIFVAYNI